MLVEIDEPAPGGRLATERALERDRLAGDARRCVAVELAVLVHHPGHRLGVGAHVGRRDVAVRPEQLLDLVDERAGDPLQFVRVADVGGAVHATLRAAEGDPGDGGLPGHQRGQRADLVEVDLRVEPDSALVGASRPVVLDPVAGEDVDLPVAEPDRDLDLDLPVGGLDYGREVVGDTEPVNGLVEVVGDDLVVRDLGAARATLV